MSFPDQNFKVEVREAEFLSQQDISQIVDLCSRAFEEPYAPYLNSFKNPVHVLGKIGDVLVSHALWITRWLQVEGGLPMKTAYVEGVATEQAQRGKGYASAVMNCLADQIQDYEIAALSPAETTLYSRLGWKFWQGPLFTRKEGQWLLLPDEAAMVLCTKNTPQLEFQAPLSIEWREGEVW